MNPEGLLMAGGLNNVPKDRRLMAAGASRMEKLLGFSPRISILILLPPMQAI